MENQEIMNCGEFEIEEVSGMEQEVENEGNIAGTIGVTALVGLALYGGYKVGQKVVAGGKKLVGKAKTALANRKAAKESDGSEEAEAEN